MLVFDIRSGKVIKRLPVGDALAIKLNTKRKELYITQRETGRLLILDATTYARKRPTTSSPSQQPAGQPGWPDAVCDGEERLRQGIHEHRTGKRGAHRPLRGEVNHAAQAAASVLLRWPRASQARRLALECVGPTTQEPPLVREPISACFRAEASYRHWLGQPLPRPAGLLAADVPAWLHERAPYALLAHGTEADPLFCYANRQALSCFGYPRAEFIGMPSRFSASPRTGTSASA